MERKEGRKEGAKWDWVIRTMRSATDIVQVTERSGERKEEGRNGSAGGRKLAFPPPLLPSFLLSFLPSSIGYRSKLAHTATDHKYWKGPRK